MQYALEYQHNHLHDHQYHHHQQQQQQQFFDNRQKEQLRMELTGEIMAAIDAYMERIGTIDNVRVDELLQLIQRLKQFIDDGKQLQQHQPQYQQQ